MTMEMDMTPTDRPADPAILTVAEYAARYRLSTKTVRRLIAAGELKAIRLGRSVRIVDKGDHAFK